ncbi:MAG: bifunctional [glutamate--ammonia ligase]-adenylyl-L-tyrosine phosphorylase/[glutamate--ammonia-ligase] adenylyltransferase [Wenzhouxiangella sp.]
MRRAIDITVDDLKRLSTFAAEAGRRFPEAGDPANPVDRPSDELLHDDPQKALRQYRQLASVNILWRDLTGQNDIAQTGRQISALARDCLDLALAVAERSVAERHGQLLAADGQPIRLSILGLGKLGGDELNFNSDVDLVFAWTGRKAISTGPRRLEAAEYLKRVARELIKLLDTVTEDGRVWIVDTRLRPFGDSGALVWSVSAMEQYFVGEGRTWERYAWLKAGPAAGDTETADHLLNTLQPFVFRRYLDYGIFDSLRDLHSRIDASSRARSQRDDIKRGAGGIRELEFLVQSQQILRGGRVPALRSRGFLPALTAAVDLGLFKGATGRQLEQAYSFLRILENRLQAMTARQGHHLPEDDQGQAYLAELMGHDSWSALKEEINHHRHQVRRLFSERFREPGARAGVGARLWPPESDLEQRLDQAGFARPQAIAGLLETLHQRTANRALSAEGHRRLEKLMPLLLEETGKHQPPDTGLEDLLHLVDQISRRSAYLALLYERPATLARLIRVFRASSRLAEWIVASPQLLDDLLDPIHGFDLPTPPDPEPNDPEATLHALGRWRQAGYLRTALAELDERLDAHQAAQQLTGIAETILTKVLALISENEPDLAVIGYGNLGAGLLHYESDLDLVFLHDDGPAPVRTAQRLISFMQMLLPGGRLFEIDTRLRPNGQSGLLVSRLDAFADYQATNAWTWEHQALIRARWVAGNPTLATGFEQARLRVLCQVRQESQVRTDLAAMRLRQQRERREDPIKARLTDVQYIAELGILTQAARHPQLANARAPNEQFHQLAEIGWIKPDRADDLNAAWQVLSNRRHLNWLERSPDQILPEAVEQTVADNWSAFFGPTHRREEP